MRTVGRILDALIEHVWMLIVGLLLISQLSGCSPLHIRASITPETYQGIRRIYHNEQVGEGMETAYCLYGGVYGVEMLVTGLARPTITSRDSVSVNYNTRNCHDRGSLLGSGHTHPPGYVCAFSDTDWISFSKSPYQYSFLSCENVTLAVYTRDQIPRVDSLVALLKGSQSTRVATATR
jgi:hypothetical protein